MIPPLIFESATAHGPVRPPKLAHAAGGSLVESREKWYFGITPDRAWHGLLNASKIGVLKICKDAPASKEFS
jgi:hypothetical protein